MGYSLAMIFKTIKKILLSFLLKIFTALFIVSINLFANFFGVLWLIPIICFVINYIFFRNSDIITVICSWMGSLLPFFVFVIYMYNKNSSLGIALVGMLHLYTFTISDFIYIIFKMIKKAINYKHKRKTGDGSLSRK